MMRLAATSPSPRSGFAARRWAVAGLLLGALAALLLQAPASWLARALAGLSDGHLLLVDSRGTVWDGSGELVLTGGAGSRDASRLPGRAHWQLGWQAGAPELRLRLDCCSSAVLPLRVDLIRQRLALPAQAEPLLRLPAGWLAGLGTPWNTLQLGGQLRLASRGFALQRQQGRWQAEGELELELHQLSSRLSTLAPLGSYRLGLAAQAGSATRLMLTTLDGALLLQGEGSAGGGERLRFRGEARAAEGREAVLNNLLNIIGRRQGERSVITIG